MIDYHVDAARAVVVTRVTGRVTFSEFANHLQRILRDRHANHRLATVQKQTTPAVSRS